MKTKKLLIIIPCTLIVIGIIISSIARIHKYRNHVAQQKMIENREATKTYATLEERAKDAKEFARIKNLNQNYCIFVDYSIPSGTPRVFVWSFKENKIVAHTYTMHGPGKGSTKETPVFSNQHGSKCSSIGKFKVTKSHGHHLGANSFRLVGYDKTNSNAWNRGLMIHSSTWVNRNKNNKFIPLNSISCQGCITTTTIGLQYLKRLINSERKNMLLWAYC